MRTGVGHVSEMDPKTGRFKDAVYCQTCDARKKSGAVVVKICTRCGLQVCWEHFSEMERYPCSAGDSKNRLHDWRGSFDYHSTKEEKFLDHVRRKPSRRNRFPDVGGCNICYTAKSPGVRPTKVCAYCGLQVCNEHYAPLTKTYCQRGELEYLDSYYLHEWYDWDVYNDETKWPTELQELHNTGTGSEIEIVGFRNGKLVVKSTGVVLPPGGKVTTHVVLRTRKV